MQSTTIYYWIYHITEDKLKLGFVRPGRSDPCGDLLPVQRAFCGSARKAEDAADLHYQLSVLRRRAVLPDHPAAMTHLGQDSVLWLIYTFVFIGGAIRAFYGPASFALVGMLVPRTLYANATSWSSMAWQIGAVLGPLTAGVMIAWKGVEAGMALVVLVELIPLLAILAIKTKPILKKG